MHLLGQDNLNTHFYKALPPEEAFDLAKKFEYHYTPKKGSWPNMAEIELSALSKQCLDRRIGAWEQERNAIRATVKLKINKIDAKVELQRQYVKVIG